MTAKRSSGLGRWWAHRKGVRVRTTVSAVLVVGAALAVAAVAMVFLLQRSLMKDVERSALLQASTVEDLIDSPAYVASLPVSDDEDEFVQAIDDEGRVVASSANVAGRPALARLDPGETEKIQAGIEDEEDPDETERFLVIATDAGTANEGFTIVVGRSLETVEETMDAVVGLLLAGFPLLLLVVTFVTWGVVGRALRPVESIRSEVEEISTHQLHRRVPTSDAGDEIARLAATMNQMLQRLEEGQERQMRFVSDASHELRSPVASIRQHVEVAIAHPERASLEELAMTVLDEDLRIQHLVEDLLLLARMDEHSLEVGEDATDLDDVVFEEVARLRGLGHKRVDVAGVSGGRVTGDPKHLARLVGNLLDNAARHAREVITVSLAEVGDLVTLRVDDDGAGVPPVERARIFDRFVRLQEARDRDSGGSGLGLAIVSEVARTYGATVDVLEAPSGGARFEVRFRRRSD
jgi:signal transduction histidine kinase